MVDFLSTRASDNMRLARSKRLVEKADGTYALINLPRYAFVKDMWFYITQAYAGGANGAATIGFIGNGETADPDGFFDAAWAAGRVAGVKRMSGDTQPGSKGKWFNEASGQITITLAAGTDTTLLIGYVFAEYSVIY